MLVEIWSDVVCPWCYIGKRRFESALAGFEGRDRVDVLWRSFELDPQAPPERSGRYVERLAAKYGTSAPVAEAMIARVETAAADEGIDMRFDISRPGNTFDAHRLLHLAAGSGRQPQMAERLWAATFTEGHPVGDPATLARLAGEVGLDPGAVADVLQTDAYATEVRSDEAEAASLGITGVPFFAFDRRYGAAGAQRPDRLLEVLRRAADEQTEPAGDGRIGLLLSG